MISPASRLGAACGRVEPGGGFLRVRSLGLRNESVSMRAERLQVLPPRPLRFAIVSWNRRWADRALGREGFSSAATARLDRMGVRISGN